METHIAPRFQGTPDGREAEAILRNCVHCGFCTATCPTYRLTGDELDGPRGRIYLVKQYLEGETSGRHMRYHLDRCLSCRSCETTCPSGVRYARLADIGRRLAVEELPAPPLRRLVETAIRAVIPHPRRFGALLGTARLFGALLPPGLRRKMPPVQAREPWPVPRHPRRMVALTGCVQEAATPATNAAAARVLDGLGISLEPTPGAGCCGALSLHLGHMAEARAFARRNIDAWWPALEAGAEGVVASASGCCPVLREYGDLLAGDPDYAERAREVAGRVRDLSEVVDEACPADPGLGAGRAVAVHCPCSLQHGLGLGGVVERILEAAGYRLTAVKDGHICCGSAGTFSILQPAMAERLKRDKLAALEGPEPDLIVTANVGCQLHLASGSTVPVRHWIELLDPAARP
ncbi:MAG: glycolate oxidase subunit GlcF [Gammaproteobacteria bacterium]|nr:glycolate oxidase subunit GlcF [Gammaproteobacteria bacterium]